MSEIISNECLTENEYELYKQLNELDERELMRILRTTKLYGKFDESLKAHKTLMLYNKDYYYDHQEDIDFYYHKRPKNTKDIEEWKKASEELKPFMYLFEQGKIREFEKAIKSNHIHYDFNYSYNFHDQTDLNAIAYTVEESSD